MIRGGVTVGVGVTAGTKSGYASQRTLATNCIFQTIMTELARDACVLEMFLLHFFTAFFRHCQGA